MKNRTTRTETAFARFAAAFVGARLGGILLLSLSGDRRAR